MLAVEWQRRDFERVAGILTTRARLDHSVVEFTFWTRFHHDELSKQAWLVTIRRALHLVLKIPAIPHHFSVTFQAR